MPYPQPRTTYRAAAPAAEAGASRVSRVRAMVRAAIAPLLLGYLTLAVVLAVITAVSSGSAFSLGTALAGAGPAWLAACHVPLTVEGASLGVLPLLLTALVVALAARAARHAAGRLLLRRPAETVPVLATVGGAHAVAGAVIAGSAGGPVTANPALAFFVCGAVGLVAAAAGLARPCGLVTAVLGHADAVLRRGLRAGVLGLAALLACGAFGYALGMLCSFSQGAEMFLRLAPGAGSGLGLFLLSAAYLPNAVVGGLSFVLGPGVSIGPVAVAPVSFHGGAVPAFPLLAAIPDEFAAWWPLLFVLPLAAGVTVGEFVRRSVAELRDRLRAVAVAALVAAVASLVLAAMASGTLGGGAFGPVTVPAGLLAVTAFGWIGVPGALVVWLADGGPSVASVTGRMRWGGVPEQPADVDDTGEAAGPAASDDTELAGETVDCGAGSEGEAVEDGTDEECDSRHPDGAIDYDTT